MEGLSDKWISGDYSKTVIGTRILADKSGFSRIFQEKSVKIRLHPVKSAFQ